MCTLQLVVQYIRCYIRMEVFQLDKYCLGRYTRFFLAVLTLILFCVFETYCYSVYHYG